MAVPKSRSGCGKGGPRPSTIDGTMSARSAAGPGLCIKWRSANATAGTPPFRQTASRTGPGMWSTYSWHKKAPPRRGLRGILVWLRGLATTLTCFLMLCAPSVQVTSIGLPAWNNKSDVVCRAPNYFPWMGTEIECARIDTVPWRNSMLVRGADDRVKAPKGSRSKAATTR